jgi:chromosomal replication initiation ATPase DnaA
MTARHVFNAVSFAFGVPRNFAELKTRTDKIARARFAAWKIIRDQKTMHTLVEIGLMSGGRDHGSVINGLRRAAELIERDPDFAGRYTYARELLIEPIHIQTITT